MMDIADPLINAFIEKHALPERFRLTVERCYRPLCDWIDRRRGGATFLLGINGAQGTGKTTLARFLREVHGRQHGLSVATLSIDDGYLSRDERRRLAASLHPLFETRGVPGTHDVGLLKDTLATLRSLGEGETSALPRFDKASDDRAPAGRWPVVEGPVDVVILEGWCVGSRPQPDAMLAAPVNALERDEDPDGRWRRYANEQLAGPYRDVFDMLDALAFLAAPDLDAVFRWRLEQERKLANRASGDAAGVMDERALARFVSHYERLTRWNLETLPELADVVLDLDDKHACSECRIRE